MTVKILPARERNFAKKVDALIRIWDRPLSEKEKEMLAQLAPVKQQVSDYGNINNGAPNTLSSSCLISRTHPHFENVIEPGAKDLVVCVAKYHNLITYTSCGGHRYDDGTANNRRHVGIIARDDAEQERAMALFMAAGEVINARYPDAAIEIAVMPHALQDGDKSYPALDLYLHNKPEKGWDAYFAEADEICKALTDCLYEQAVCAPLQPA